MEVHYHPLFERWLTELADLDEEVFGEVLALLTALEVHGRDLDDESQEESHPGATAPRPVLPPPPGSESHC